MKAHQIYKKKFLQDRFRNLSSTPGCHEFNIIVDGLKPTFNIGKIFRSAEVFGAKAVHLIDIKYFNPFPSKGGFRRVPAFFHPTFQPCFDQLISQQYTIFVLDAKADQLLGEVDLPLRSAFVVGHEEYGVSFDPKEFAAVRLVKIPQFGRVQSLNASVAASIAMYEYVNQMQLAKKKALSDFESRLESINEAKF